MKSPVRKPIDLKEDVTVAAHTDSLSNRFKRSEFQYTGSLSGLVEDDRQMLIIHYCLECHQLYSHVHRNCPNCGATKERSLEG